MQIRNHYKRSATEFLGNLVFRYLLIYIYLFLFSLLDMLLVCERFSWESYVYIQGIPLTVELLKCCFWSAVNQLFHTKSTFRNFRNSTASGLLKIYLNC